MQPEEQTNNSSTSGTFECRERLYTSVIFLFVVLTLLYMISDILAAAAHASYKASLPRFSIEEITSSNINISSSSSLPHYSSLSAQNLTINFVVENHAPREIECKVAVVTVSYKGYVLWTNMLGLYQQEKGERTLLQVNFDNSPVEIRGDNVAKEISTTSGYGNFTVDVIGIYDSEKLFINCRDVKIHQLSSSIAQDITPQSPKRCSIA